MMPDAPTNAQTEHHPDTILNPAANNLGLDIEVATANSWALLDPPHRDHPLFIASGGRYRLNPELTEILEPSRRMTKYPFMQIMQAVSIFSNTAYKEYSAASYNQLQVDRTNENIFEYISYIIYQRILNDTVKPDDEKLNDFVPEISTLLTSKDFGDLAILQNDPDRCVREINQFIQFLHAEMLEKYPLFKSANQRFMYENIIILTLMYIDRCDIKLTFENFYTTWLGCSIITCKAWWRQDCTGLTTEKKTTQTRALAKIFDATPKTKMLFRNLENEILTLLVRDIKINPLTFALHQRLFELFMINAIEEKSK
jgi:hypothetical protein